MESVSHKFLERRPYQTYPEERRASTELLRRPPRTLEEKIAFVALSVCYGDGNAYDANTAFMRPIEALWSEETIYSSNNEGLFEKYEVELSDPPEDIEYFGGAFDPTGQCGPPINDLALIYSWTDLMKRGEIENTYLEEGSLWATASVPNVHEGGSTIEKDKLLSDHHVWIRVVGNNGQSWRIDLTAYQYMSINPDESGHIRLVMQGVDHLTNMSIPGVNWRVFKHKDDWPDLVPNSSSLIYEPNPDKVVPIKEYDIRRFKKRINGREVSRAEYLMGAMGTHEVGLLGNPGSGIEIRPDWFPDHYNFDEEVRGEESRQRTEDIPKIPLPKALELIEQDSKGEAELSLEGLGILLKQLVEQSDTHTLMTWAINCAERTLPIVEDRYPNDDPRKAIEMARMMLQEKSVNRQELNQVTKRLSDWERDLSEAWWKSNSQKYWNGLEEYKGTEQYNVWWSQYVRHALDAIIHVSHLANSSAEDFKVGAFNSVERAAMAIDFSAMDFAHRVNRNERTQNSERHWQYLELYNLLDKKKAA